MEPFTMVALALGALLFKGGGAATYKTILAAGETWASKIPNHALPGKTAESKALRRANAQVIEETLKANKWGDDRVIQAAIVNAVRESGLRNDAAGDGGHSIGLFQLNDHGGLGVGVSKEDRYNPVKNTLIMIKWLNKSYGAGFRKVAADPNATAEDLADAWTRYLERPKFPEAEGQKSRALVRKLWPQATGSLT